MSITITQSFEFDAGHRILGHESKCAYLHGHRYVAKITVKAKELDDLGRVIDFGQMKRVIGKWIDDNWDHNMILNQDDPLLQFSHLADVLESTHSIKYIGIESTKLFDKIFAGRIPYMLPYNPTAENLAKYLFTVSLCALKKDTISAPYDLNLTKIRLYETPKCYADYVPGPDGGH